MTNKNFFSETTNKILLFIFVAFVFLSFIYLISPLFNILSWSGILSFFLYPIYKQIYSRIKRKNLSAFLVLAIFFLFIVLPLSLITSQLYQQLLSFAKLASSYLNQNWQEILQNINSEGKNHLILSKLYSKISPFLPNIQQRISEILSDLLSQSVSIFGNILKFAMNFVIELVFTIIVLYYFLVDGEKILEILQLVIPAPSEEKEQVFLRVSQIMKGVLYGTILTALIQGFLAFIFYLILGIPRSLLWGVLTAFSSFIPVVGTSLIWFPITLYLFITGHYIKAIILFLLSALIVSQIDNFIKPFIIGGKAKVHNLLIFFAILGGIAKFGFLGLFLGPFILGLFLAIFEIYRYNITKNHTSQNFTS